MSKKQWQPPIKINEPDPAVRPLPKVRLLGMDADSDVGREMLAKFAGRIGQFHMEQAQNYSLAPQQIYRGYRDHPDVRLRYTNMFGREIIDVIPRGGGQPEEKPKEPEYWDSAVIELIVEGTLQDGEFAAFLTSPRLHEIIEGEYPGGNLGETYDGDPWEEAGGIDRIPILAFPDANSYGFSPRFISGGAVNGFINDAEDYRVSLRVDLRPFCGLTEVRVELYGYLDPYNARVDGPPIGSHIAGEVCRRNDPGFTGSIMDSLQQGVGELRVFPVTSSHEELIQYWPELASMPWYEWDGTNTDGTFEYEVRYDGEGPSVGWDDDAAAGGPAAGLFGDIHDPSYTYYDGAFIRTATLNYWSWFNDNTGAYSYDPPAPGPPPGHPTDTFNNYLFRAQDVVSYYVPDYQPVFEDFYPTQLATVRATLFKGLPAQGWTFHYGGDVSYRRWENPDRYPDRWGSVVIARDVPVITMDDPESEDYDIDQPFYHYGMPYVGRIIIDLVHGGISFDPA